MYIVLGQLPHCEADDLLKLCPAVQPIKPRLLRDPNTNTSSGEIFKLPDGRYGIDMTNACFARKYKTLNIYCSYLPYHTSLGFISPTN